MAKKAAEIINGYKVPGARGGAAVAKACQLIIKHPGIKQGDLLEAVTRWSYLNHSTASWITSPGSKSPAGLLWSRQKVGRSFGCFPNEHTHLLGDPRIRLREQVLKDFSVDWKAAGSPVPGDLISYFRPRWDENSTQEVEMGLMTGFVKTFYNGATYKDELLSSLDGLDDLDNFTDGSFWITPQLSLEGRLQAIPIHMIRKEAA